MWKPREVSTSITGCTLGWAEGKGRSGEWELVAQSKLLIYGNTSAVIVKIKWLPECVASGQARAESGRDNYKARRAVSRRKRGSGGRSKEKSGWEK